MSDGDDQIEELEKLVNDNRNALERAKRLLEEAKRKAEERHRDALAPRQAAERVIYFTGTGA